MIVQLRGTSGSGKSTVVYTLMKRFKTAALQLALPNQKAPCAYQISIPRGKPLFVLGPYNTPCGGCDALPSDTVIVRKLIEILSPKGHVLLEGLLMSGYYGEFGRWSERYGGDFVLAFLNTPLHVCLERIAARRRARGDKRPLDPTNTASKFRSVWDTYDRVRLPPESAQGRKQVIHGAARRCIIIDYRRATEQLLHLLTDGRQGKDNGRHLRPLEC